MKHTKHILLMAAMLLGSLSVSAEVVQIDGIWYDVVKKAKQAEVVSNPDGTYSGNITIPSIVEYDGVECSVTSIGENAFIGCSSLSSITLPKGVTSIGDYAFYYCESLTSITLPESVTSIGDYAFEGCSSLKSITLPEGVTSIGEGAFTSCRSLTAITIPKSVTSIGNYTFYWCSSLTAITIPEGVTSIGNQSFHYCYSLTSVYISDIAAWCNIKFPDYESNPLSHAQNLYLNGELVTELTLPESVTRIKDYAFYNCSSLTSITLPESVTSIGGSAFFGCSSLTSITIPENVTSIENGVFRGCISLTAIILPEGVTSIGERAFRECSSLTAINIPEGVTSIGEYAFRDCSSLTAINIPEGVTSIGEETFSGCSSLTSINIPEGVTSIASSSFKDCNKLTTLVLPKSLKRISASAFANCESLLDVYCHAEQVPSTDESAFENSYPEYITLHVPLKALDDYKATAPWSSFGKNVSVEVAVAEISLSQTSATLTEGGFITLSASVSPENAENKSVAWSSSNLNIATVDEAGVVNAIAPGTAVITATANDCSGVSASCEVTVVEKKKYSVTFMLDDEAISRIESETPINDVVLPDIPEKEGFTINGGWRLVDCDAVLADIDIKNNADAMLYSNALCTNTEYGDEFKGWHVLFDGDANTFFHSEYSEDVNSTDGLDHYLRVDMGEGKAISKFTFTFTTRGDQYYHSPSTIVVEGSNTADGEYEEIALVTGLPREQGAVYESEILGNGKAYRYIRYRVVETFLNKLVCGHPYFHIAEFGMKSAENCHNVVYQATYSRNSYYVYYYVGETIVRFIEVPYGGSMPVYVYEPTKDTEEFLGWKGETYETMPAHDVTYVANIKTYMKCATPTVSYANGRLTFSCETASVKYVTEVVAASELNYTTKFIDFIPAYTFKTYATKSRYMDSNVTYVTICWIDCTEEHGTGEDDGVITVPAQPVLIQSVNGVLTITGLADGTVVTVYDTAGFQLTSTVATGDTATMDVGFLVGQIAIVKIGDSSVKVMVQ